MIKISLIIRKVKFYLIVKYLYIKLKIKKKSPFIERSPYSESIYIMYMYEGNSRNYIKLRVSMHKNTRYENSQIRILI